VLAALPRTALAKVPSFVPKTNGKYVNGANVVSTSSAEKKAYRRAVKACMDYANQPNPIVVDVSDLGLSNAQAEHVAYLVRSNSELFWISTYVSDSQTRSYFNSEQLTLYCTADDETIDTQRAQLEKAAKKAGKRIASGMDDLTRVHMIHDYLIDTVNYKAKDDGPAKTAYSGLVNHICDCAGFTQTMDLLMRRAGLTTDMAYSLDGTHTWNLVKVGGSWYHIDLTWDRDLPDKNPEYFPKQHLHLYLLQSDARMKKTSISVVNGGYLYSDSIRHPKWWAHHSCTRTTYAEAADDGTTSSFAGQSCKEYKRYTSGFVVDGMKYREWRPGRVQLCGVSGSKQKKATSLTLPNYVTYKGTRYRVVGIEAGALKGCAAKRLDVELGAWSTSS
jgi:hypothetical protein